MNYEEIVGQVKKAYDKADAKSIAEHIAVQFNVYGEGEGAFYLELAEGKVNVEPYEYYDRDALLVINKDQITELTSAKTTYSNLIDSASISVEGNVEKVKLLDNIVIKAAKKTATKSTTKKATTTKKAEAKSTTTKKTTAKKAEPKKAEAKATTAKKATTKKTTATKETAAKTTASKADATTIAKSTTTKVETTIKKPVATKTVITTVTK